MISGSGRAHPPRKTRSGTDFFVTSAGLVGAESTFDDFEGFDKKGIPEFVRMRRATQDANSIDEWCAIMRRGNNGGYSNAWLIGDVNSGEIARLELSLKYVGYEKKRDGFPAGNGVPKQPCVICWSLSYYLLRPRRLRRRPHYGGRFQFLGNLD